MDDDRLRERLDMLEARQKLNDATDAALELAQRDRLPLAQTMENVLPLLCSHLGADMAWIRTYDESLALREFSFGTSEATPFPIEGDTMDVATRDGTVLVRRAGAHFVVAQTIDVAGEDFGVAAIAIDAERFEAERTMLYRTLLDTWCEELDNYLAAIAIARRKHVITTRLSEALREPLVDVGVRRAIEVLQEHVTFDDMLVVFRYEDDLRGASLHYKIIEDGVLTHDSRSPDMEVDEFVRTQAAPLLRGESRALLSRFGMDRGREEVLIAGLRDQRIVGRIVVTSEHGDFASYDRDLLELFADYLRQRVADFNREWKSLSRIFCPSHVRRLLTFEDYVERWLAPREVDAAILYTDISGFTRITEQVLGEPSKVGDLVNGWGREVVEIVWDEGGVFDKMVGDCVIALWGPPFGDLSPEEACRRAASAARRIRDYTRTLNDGALLPELAGVTPPIGVASGLHYTRGSVGLFGPHEDYTAFSSGMNNTARLQAVATCDEILCMDAFVEAYGDETAFGPERDARVKNVAEPIRFRPLR
ncbi:MAG: adenylate/guanylate cyclase domain-containing protein [Myxococcales bacterium]|nr:adenylate/guanylate cyclase domain-containing protein [Myxococcales bacterium]